MCGLFQFSLLHRSDVLDRPCSLLRSDGSATEEYCNRYSMTESSRKYVELLSKLVVQ